MPYFDYQTSSYPTDGVIEAMKPYLQERYASIVAAHSAGFSVHRDSEVARKHLRTLFGAGEDDIALLASSGATAVNQVIHGVWASEALALGKNHFLVGQNDEAPAILSIERLEELDCHHDLLPVNTMGSVDPDRVRRALTPRTALVSLSLANGMTGAIQPIAEIAKICREEGVLLHVETTHALPSLSMEFSRWGLDFATCSGEQLHGPKGTGALIARRGLHLPPMIATGGESPCFSVEFPGALIGLGQAAKETLERREQVNTAVALMRHRFLSRVRKGCPAVCLPMEERECVATIAVVAFPKVPSELMAYQLDRKNIHATFGGGKYQQIHYILKAMGIDAKIAQCSLSFSFSHLMDPQTVSDAADTICEVYNHLLPLTHRL